MKKDLAINILISAASVFVIFLAAEIIMRFSWEMGGWVKRPIYRKSLDPYLRYELVPKAESGKVMVNSDGFRGPEYSIVKPANTFRIIMAGDSETLSVMLEQIDTLPGQLEKLLNQQSRLLHYEVINFGVEGYNTLQELEMLQKKGLKYNPDLIVLNYCLNDPEPGEYFFNKNFWMRHSALARYFSYRIKKALIKRERERLNIRTEPEHFYYLYQPKYFSRIEKAVIDMAKIAKAGGNKLAVVIFPTSSSAVKDFKQNYPYGPLHSLVKGIKSDNIIFIDLMDEFNRLGLTPEDVSINYKYEESHKNASALGVSAQYIYKTLKDNGIIPQ